MNSRPLIAAVTTFAAVCLITGCASGTSKNPPPAGGATSSTPAGASATNTTSSNPGGGRTMSAPHIACRQGNVEQTYDGSNPNPVELCIVTGAVAHIRINPPAGAKWPLAAANPASVVRDVASRRTGDALDVTLVAQAHGTATLAVANMWKLTIAVI